MQAEPLHEVDDVFFDPTVRGPLSRSTSNPTAQFRPVSGANKCLRWDGEGFVFSSADRRRRRTGTAFSFDKLDGSPAAAGLMAAASARARRLHRRARSPVRLTKRCAGESQGEQRRPREAQDFISVRASFSAFPRARTRRRATAAAHGGLAA